MTTWIQHPTAVPFSQDAMNDPYGAPALLSAIDAAAYLGVSRSYFDDHIRPFVAFVDMRRPGGKQPMPRWARVDLDRFWLARRVEKAS